MVYEFAPDRYKPYVKELRTLRGEKRRILGQELAFAAGPLQEGGGRGAIGRLFRHSWHGHLSAMNTQITHEGHGSNAEHGERTFLIVQKR